MNIPFRENHLFKILNLFEKQSGPLDFFLSNYFRANKALGSKDRRFISETAYGMIKWQGLLDYFAQKPISWEGRFKIYKGLNPTDHLANPDIPLHVRLSFPKRFFQFICMKLGEAKAVEFCLASNGKAPTTLRVNLSKTTREELLANWNEQFPVSPCPYSSAGIIFHRRANFFSFPEFKQGLFEIQDEGSQLISDLVEAEPGQQVLDFCSGSGGKTLAFAHRMAGKGQIYLHDIRPNILHQAKKRLCRAGVQNAQIIFPDDLKKSGLKGKMDWVLVDVPCSGSGTLRRNPDMKWKFENESVEKTAATQRSIFERALEFLHPLGHIVYATCSVFPDENERQVDYFLNILKLKLKSDPFKSSPVKGGMDGFFGAVFSFD